MFSWISAAKNLLSSQRRCADCGVVTEEHNAAVYGTVNGLPLQFHNIHFENLCSVCTLNRVVKTFNEGVNVSNQPCLFYPQERRTVRSVGSIMDVHKPKKICALLGSTGWGNAFVSQRAIAELLSCKKRV